MERGRILSWCRISILLATIGCACSKILSVDLGSESLKVAAIAPRSVGVVINEMSKRKTPALVGFSQGERVVGEPAYVKAGLYPDRIVPYARDALGVLYDESDELMESLWKERYLPAEFVRDPDRGTVRFRLGQGEEYAAEELVAMILEYAKGIGEAHLEGKVSDVVMTVPAWFGQSQRQALIDAASLAGLNTLALINSHAAAALQYGIEKDFTNKTEHVVLYDLGANSVEVAHVKFSSFVLREGFKNNTYSQFETVGVAWDSETGAEDLDVVLMNHFAEEFESLHPGSNLKGSPRAMAKLKRACKRTKEILSANNEAPLSVESLHNDIDFRTSITRSKLEELAGDFFARAALPLKKLIDSSGLALEDFAAFEMLGGGTRVPGVRQALEDVIGSRTLDKHLDADEASVLGAALHAANISTSFRLRKFGMSDIATYDLALEQEVENPNQGVSHSKPKRAALVSQSRRVLPLKKTLTMKEQFEDFTVSLHYGSDRGLPLPRGSKDSFIGHFSVSGVAEAGSKLKNATYLGKTNVAFTLGLSGIVGVDKVEAVVELSEVVKVPIISSNNATNSSAEVAQEGEPLAEKSTEKAKDHDSSQTKDETNNLTSKEDTPETESEDAVSTPTDSPQVELQEKIVTRVTRVPLKFQAKMRVPSMDAEAMQASMANLEALRRKDQARREAAAAKNDLESYILHATSMLQNDEDVMQVSNEETRQELIAKLAEEEDWLYMDGADADAAEFKKRLAHLQSPCESIFQRALELTKRPEAVENALAFLRKAKDMVVDWEKSKPWINSTKREQALEDIDLLQDWVDASVRSQESKSLTEDPVFSSKEVDSKVEQLEKTIERLRKTKKPKPPPPTQEANATASEKEQKNTQGGEQDAPGEGDAEGKPTDPSPEDSSGKSEHSTEDPLPKDEL